MIKAEYINSPHRGRYDNLRDGDGNRFTLNDFYFQPTEVHSSPKSGVNAEIAANQKVEHSVTPRHPEFSFTLSPTFSHSFIPSPLVGEGQGEGQFN